MEHEPSPAPEDVPAEGVYCTLRLIRKKDGSEISRYPVDGEVTSFGRDESNDVRLYYNDISRFHCTLHSSPDSSNATLKVTGTNGVEVNGTLVKPPAEVELKAGDMFEMRKKRFVISFPHAAAPSGSTLAFASPAKRATTPRRKRPSQRMSLMPNDLPQSPYAASPLRKPVSRTSSAAQGTPTRPLGTAAADEGGPDAVGTPIRGKPDTAGSTPFKTPRSIPLPPSTSMTPYAAPATPAPALASTPTVLPTPPKPARKVGPHGPSSLRKAILMREVKKAVAGGGGSGGEEERSPSPEAEDEDAEPVEEMLETESEEPTRPEDEEDESMAEADVHAEEEEEMNEGPIIDSANNFLQRPLLSDDVFSPVDEMDGLVTEEVEGMRLEEPPVEEEGDSLVSAAGEDVLDKGVDAASMGDGQEAEVSFEAEADVEPTDDAAEPPAIQEPSELHEVEPGSPSPAAYLAPALPGTPQMAARPLPSRFFTPQPASSSMSNAPRSSALLRTMGPPVRIAAPRPSPSASSRMGLPIRVPISEKKAGPGQPVGAVGRFVKAESGTTRRTSLGSPIRMPKQPEPERREESQPSPHRSTPSAAERAARRDSTASILASAPRTLPRLSTLDLASLSSPRKTPAAPPLALPDPAGSSSEDETSTPLRALARKAARLKRKSLGGRLSSGGEEVPRRASALFPSPVTGLAGRSTPLRSRLDQVTTGTPSSTQGTPLAATLTPVQQTAPAAATKHPTTDMGAIKHLFKAPAQTPQYSGVRQLLRTPNQPAPPADPTFTGVSALFASPRKTALEAPPSPAAAPRAEEPAQDPIVTDDATDRTPSNTSTSHSPRHGRSTPSASPAPPSPAPAPPSSVDASDAAVDDEDELVMEKDPSPAPSPAARQPSPSPAPEHAKPATTTRTRAAAPIAKKAMPTATSRKRKPTTPPPASVRTENEAQDADEIEADDAAAEEKQVASPPPRSASRSRATVASKTKATTATKPRATRKATVPKGTTSPQESTSPDRRSPSLNEDDDEDDVIAVESPEPKRPTARSRAAVASTTAAAKKPAVSKKAAAPPAANKPVASRTRKATTPIDEDDDDDEDMGEKNSIPAPKTTRGARATTSRSAATVPAAIVPKPRAPRKAAAAVKDEVLEEAPPPARATRATRSRK